MNVAVAEFTRSLLNRDDLSSSSVAELRQLVDRYPYFLPARLLYLKKLQAGNEDGLEEEMRNAEIWMPNTAWLDQLMFDTGLVTVIPEAINDNASDLRPAREIHGRPAASEEGWIDSSNGREQLTDLPA